VGEKVVCVRLREKGMGRKLACILLAGCLGGMGIASQYWVAYEGNDFPENQGWERAISSQYGGAQRSIETDAFGNNYLVIDSLASQMIYDFAEMDRPINPTQPGERFICEWRLLMAEQYGYREGAVGIAPDQYGILGFGYTRNEIVSETEGWSLPIAPGMFHTYRLESYDMINYELWIDDVCARSGTWYLNSLNRSFINFGDGTQGGQTRSVEKWDYFRFGVVPEPGCAMLLIMACVCGGRRHR
jgi:hypothetical protein